MISFSSDTGVLIFFFFFLMMEEREQKRNLSQCPELQLSDLTAFCTTNFTFCWGELRRTCSLGEIAAFWTRQSECWSINYWADFTNTYNRGHLAENMPGSITFTSCPFCPAPFMSVVACLYIHFPILVVTAKATCFFTGLVSWHLGCKEASDACRSLHADLWWL